MMKSLVSTLAVSVFFFYGCNNSGRTADSNAGKDSTKAAGQYTPAAIEKLVQEAYFHCFPIVENYKAIYAYAVNKSSPKYLPFNIAYKSTALYSPADKFVVSPNNDTYYTTANLDLRAEPIIIKVPEVKDRYYSFQLISMVTDNFGYIGTNSTGSKANVYAVTSPNFSGKLPEGVIEIKSPSELVGLIGRTAVNADDPNDVKKAKQLLEKYQVGVMSKFFPGFPPKPAEPINFPSFDEADKTNERFFSLLNFLLPYTKLSAGEQGIINNYKAIGIEAGKPYTFYNDNPDLQPAISNGIKRAIAQIDSSSKHLGKIVNGWSMFPLGDYFGNNYTDRTNIAKIGIYANSPKEAYYPLAFTDSQGEILDGKHNYSITFPAGNLPPAKFFWSLTMYENSTQLLVENPIKRYSIGDRTKSMKPNADGSLTIYLGHAEPKQGRGNWLPAPAAGFNVMMRIYGPKENVLDGSWTPPGIIRL
ncbi:DUF1254 domain-containing protein [Flavihumibacter profundi]|uniref:DUF1254 domain-containing protein n=1 Tax=Flavihumibacter profundi TaxID=2716883 RepID=UPI001CC75882|nr:DUF1254 domain-containing protein [Flavihumibacter profundi]MBZ5857719.1 DUF1254 domain-containing protein [Flavihumibacter profundi]